MGSKSDYLENKEQDHILGGPDFTRPATVYVALFTDPPADDGTGGTEVTIGVGGYVRVAVTNNITNWPASSGGQKKNGTEIAFPQATGSWGVIMAFGIYDASSGGNLLHWGLLIDVEYVFTALAATDVFTAPGHTFIADNQVRLESVPGLSIPTGVAVETTYYVVGISGDTFNLATTAGGAAINITANGGGLIGKHKHVTVGIGDVARFNPNDLVIEED